MDITKTCPCDIQRFFLALKIETFQLKNVDIFLIFAKKHRLWAHLTEAVLTSTTTIYVLEQKYEK